MIYIFVVVIIKSYPISCNYAGNRITLYLLFNIRAPPFQFAYKLKKEEWKWGFEYGKRYEQFR